MRKKYGRIAVFVLGCILAVWGMIIYPILNRGSIAVSFSNTTDHAFTILRINDQSVNLQLDAGGSTTVDYFISGEERISVFLEEEGGNLFEQEITDGFTGMVTPQNYGRALVTIKEKKGNIELSILNNIS